MSKATVLDLVTDYAFNLSSVTIHDYYDDLMWDAARWGVASSVQLIPSERGDATYTLPAETGKMYALFYDDVMLSLAALQDLEAVNPSWRDQSGRPNSYVVQDTSLHDVTLYPAPDQNAKDFVFLFGAPMGHDFPDRAIGAVIGERRDDLPQWMDIPLALTVLAREFDEASEHQDHAFAAQCRALGNELLALVLA